MRTTTHLPGILLLLLLGLTLFPPTPAAAEDFEIDLKLTRAGSEELFVEWFPPSDPNLEMPAKFLIQAWAPGGDGALESIFEISVSGSLREYTLPVSILEKLSVSVEAQNTAGDILGISPRDFDPAGVRDDSVPLDGTGAMMLPDGASMNEAVSGLSCEIRSLEIGRFPLIYMNVNVLRDGLPATDLGQSDFQITENGMSQADLFSVTPPSEGGGSRVADIVFLIDDSGSMSDKINAVRQNASNFVNNLAGEGVDFRLGLVRFGQSGGGAPQVFNGGAMTSDVNQFTSWLSSFRASGSYEPGLLAILTAAQTFNFRQGSQRIFILVTDEDSDGGSQSQLSQAVTTCQSNSITVYGAVNCGDGNSYWQYCGNGIVLQTGGNLFPVNGSYDSILGDIGNQVGSTYVVRYRSSNPTFDGQERLVRVLVSDGLGNSEDSRSYIPGAGPNIVRTQGTVDLGASGQVAGASVPIEVTVTDAVFPTTQAVDLYYKVIGSNIFSRIAMTALGSDVYRAIIPGGAVAEPGIAYYVRATDGVLSATDPTSDPADEPYHFAVLPNEPPIIVHTPPALASVGIPLEITVTAQDGTHYVETVRLYYRPFGDLLYTSGLMTEGSASNYSYSIPGHVIGADGIEYYIKATDDLAVDRTYGTADDPVMIPTNQDYVGGTVSLLRVEVSMDGGMSYDAYDVRDLVSVPSGSLVRFVGRARDDLGVPMAGEQIMVHDGHAYDQAFEAIGAIGLSQVTVGGAGEFVYPTDGIPVEGPDTLPFWFALGEISQIPYLLVVSGPCGDLSCLAGRALSAFETGTIDEVAIGETSAFERYLYPYPPDDDLTSPANDEFFGMYFMQYFGPTKHAFLFNPTEDGWLDRGMRIFSEWSKELALATPQLIQDVRSSAVAVAVLNPDGSVLIVEGADAEMMAFTIDWNVVTWGVETGVCVVGTAVTAGTALGLACAPLVLHAAGDFVVKPDLNPWLCENVFTNSDPTTCKNAADLTWDGISLVSDVFTSGGVTGITRSADRTANLGRYLANPKNLRFFGKPGRVFGRVEAVVNAVETIGLVGDSWAILDDAADVFWHTNAQTDEYVIGGVDGIIRQSSPDMPWESLPLAYGYSSLGKPEITLSSGQISTPTGPAVGIHVTSSRPLYPQLCASYEVYAPHSPEGTPYLDIAGPTTSARFPLAQPSSAYSYRTSILLANLPDYVSGQPYVGYVTIEGYDFVMNVGSDEGDCGLVECSSEPVSLQMPSGATLDLPGGSCDSGEMVTLLGTSDPAEAEDGAIALAGDLGPCVVSVRVSDVWSLGDPGIRLSKPARLTLPYSEENVPEGKSVDIWRWAEDLHCWRPLGARSGTDGRLICEVLELGLYSVRAAAILEFEINLDPDALNVKSRGRTVTAYLNVPTHLQGAEIDPTSVLLNAVVPLLEILGDDVAVVAELSDSDPYSMITMKFDRQALVASLPPVNGLVSLPFVGILDGQVFRATDEIRILGNEEKINTGGQEPVVTREVNSVGVPMVDQDGGRVSLAISLAQAGPVRVNVYDLRGRLIRTVADMGLAAGPNVLSWDQRDRTGRRVSSGIYFYRVSGRSIDEVRKFVIVH